MMKYGLPFCVGQLLYVVWPICWWKLNPKTHSNWTSREGSSVNQYGKSCNVIFWKLNYQLECSLQSGLFILKNKNKDVCPLSFRKMKIVLILFINSLSFILQGSGGVTVKKTGQALIFGIYDEPLTPGQCNMIVERLGDYLIDQGL